MAEVSALEAHRILERDASADTVKRAVDRGELQGRRIGKKRAVRVNIDSLRQFAQQYNYRFNEGLAQTLAK
jgi:hypothetical protein